MERNIPVSMAIYKISRMLKRYFDNDRREAGEQDDPSTANHGRIIGYICENSDRDVFQKDIEKEFNIRRSTATNTLKLMEKNGLIIRERTDYDERLKKITLTPQTLEKSHEIKKRMKSLNEFLEKGISEKERETFFVVLEKISKNIEEAESDD